MLFKEFDCEIKDRKGLENSVVDHLSKNWIDDACETPFSECFLDKQLFGASLEPCYVDIVNYLVTGCMPGEWSKDVRTHFLALVSYFVWDDPYLFKV